MILRKKGKKVATAFGAAMAAMYAAPELQAQLTPVTLTPGSVSTQATSVAVNVQVGPGLGSFQQWNDIIGKTIYAANFAGGGIGIVQYSSSISGSASFFSSAIGFGASSSGKVNIGFNVPGQGAGWFSANLGGLGGTITYKGGCFAALGKSTHVGDFNCIPEPTSAGLAALALGAVGLMRRRKK